MINHKSQSFQVLVYFILEITRKETYRKTVFVNYS
jgi:hypothetical protein